MSSDLDYFQPPNRTQLQHLRDQISVQLQEQPQKLALAQLAFTELESGLAKLSSLGLHFQPVEGAVGALPEWPKTMFHSARAPHGTQVYCRQDLEDLGPGWATTPQEAERLAGVKTQFAGRGGVRQPGLPMVIPQPNT